MEVIGEKKDWKSELLQTNVTSFASISGQRELRNKHLRQEKITKWDMLQGK